MPALQGSKADPGVLPQALRLIFKVTKVFLNVLKEGALCWQGMI